MIDLIARDRMARALRKLMARQVTNDKFERMIAFERSDNRVLRSIESRAWTLYSDLYEHTLDRKLTTAARSEVARWILFLQSDLEYRWPHGFWDSFPIYNWPLNLLTFGWWESRKTRLLKKWEKVGDSALWPFLDRAEFEAACAKPRFLIGSAAIA